MDRLAFNAAAAINEYRMARQAITHELANVSTPGFKRSYEVAMRAIEAEGPGMSTRVQPQATTSDVIQLKPGSVMATGRNLDVSLNDQIVLGVTGADGQLAFTRRGDLRITATGVLENGAGHAVRAEGGGVLTVPPGSDIRITGDGSVYGTNPAQPNGPGILVGRLLLRDASRSQLERLESGLFAVGGKAGQDITNGVKVPSLTPQALEGSNVNAMEALIKLMDQSRSFEQQIRVIREVKNSDEVGSSMMKLST